ncbi:hypothetical protein CSB08_00375 [Candidatus Gracilibacteria bacterium]|nr:MAG: hypothetical protein CSB08_00375 [Candidatus Gracilibacteria bacterium]PIE85298.1 MAG: hypothetical protein CSA08_02725 [Candidatus Gracilibacteria bacterium]
MFGKMKDKDYYSKLNLLLTILTLLIVTTTYLIVNSKLAMIEKVSKMQYAQIGGEENYKLLLEISDLTKEDNKLRMENYLADLKARKEASSKSSDANKSNSNSSQTIDITESIENGATSIEVGPEGVVNK